MIKSGKLLSAYICIIVFCVCLIGGFFVKTLFIFAVAGLAEYAWINKKYLRCPHCGEIIEFEK